MRHAPLETSMPRSLLTEAQRATLFDPPTAERDLIRFYALSDADRTLIQRQRLDHTRLGFALTLCYLRHPGRLLREGERPPAVLVAFVADQIGVFPEAFAEYLRHDQTRRRHAAEVQQLLRCRTFSARHEAKLAAWMLPTALVTDQPTALVGAALEELRRRNILLPPAAVIERLCRKLRHQARQQIYRTLVEDLTTRQREQLEALLDIAPDVRVSRLAWLLQAPSAARGTALLAVLDRLAHIRDLGLKTGHGHRIPGGRLRQLAREGSRTTVQHLAEAAPLRRLATLTAVAIDVSETLTDLAIDVFDRLVGSLFRRAERRHADAFHRNGRAITEKVDLYAKLGAALIAAKDSGGDAFAAIEQVIPWERFTTTVAEAAALVPSEEFNPLDHLLTHYSAIRRWAPAFLAAFEFKAVPAAEPLLRAIRLLRDLNTAGRRSLPREAPLDFVSRRWHRHVVTESGVDRRYWELCVLAELRDRLRAGDVWVVGSRQYRAFEDHLLSPAAFAEMRQSGPLPVAVNSDVDAYLADRLALLRDRLATVEAKAAAGDLVDVVLGGGQLRISPIAASVPTEAEALKSRIYDRLPRIRITELLAEVDGWTGFTNGFTHLRSGEPSADRRIVLTAVLADGLNLGLTRMAEACRAVSPRQLAWTADWYLRDDTYSQTLARLNDALHGHPFASVFGSTTSSSSDGQYFPLTGRGEDTGDVNAKYGHAPGVRLYTHLSGRYGPFNVKVISAATSEVPHVVDGLLYHQGELAPTTHHTDTGGVSEHVFALMHLLGFRFAPRIRGLKGRRLYGADPASAYPCLEPLLAGRLNTKLIRAHWDDILRLATSIRAGTVTASLMLRRLAAFPRQNGLAMALCELGRLERTLFTLDWLEDPALRRDAHDELNKGEARNSLARAVFFHRRGELQDRSREAQQHRAGGLNVVLTAIALWNTVYLARAVDTLRSEGEAVPDHLLVHLSPLGWDHINLTGDYVWDAEVRSDADALRPLRPAQPQAKAA